MKPPAFDYLSPTSLAEVHELLSTHGEDGKILAGGQSLVPLLNMRLAHPSTLIDINRVTELDYIRKTADGGLAIGALTRQQTLLEDAVVAEHTPLLVEATRYIGHRTIRNRGTVGGTLAHADPAAEMPAVMVALDAEFVVTSAGGERVIPAREFFVDYLTTALAQDELLTEVRIPAAAPRTGSAFQEVSRRHGDFAIVAVAALVTLADDGSCADARLVLTGVGGTPQALDLTGTLIGQAPTAEVIKAAANKAATEIEPTADIHATEAYRRQLARVLSRRALTAAVERAGGKV